MNIWNRGARPSPDETHMLLSIVFYAGLFLFFIALISIARPLRFLGIASRPAAAAIAGGAIVVMIAALAWPPPDIRNATESTRLDAFMPVWQFNEEHSIHVAASPERTFKAIHEVRAGEIAFFQLLTSIRRGGRKGPESIIAAPETKPLLDVATQTSFVMLADDAPHEIVIGTVIAAPREARGQRLTADLFQRKLRPGVALATMNFLVKPDGRGGSNVSTETRVYANDRSSLRAFTIYWRIIHPGSDLIRRMWLRAVRKRAEGV